MKLAIMQPYLFPYIGYWQLLSAVDCFVFYDDVNFIKRGWVNRNRLLLNGQVSTFSLPVKNASQNRFICEHQLQDDSRWTEKFLKTLRANYAKSPSFDKVYRFLEGQFTSSGTDLTTFLGESIQATASLLGINCEYFYSSKSLADIQGSGAHRILEICKELGATEYINLPGGKALYQSNVFLENGIQLKFIEPQFIPYPDKGSPVEPGLSIIDILFRTEETAWEKHLNNFVIG